MATIKRAINIRVGLNLKKLRQELGLNITQMGQRFGLTLSAYSRYESGTFFPNEEVLQALQKEFGLSMDWLLYNKGPRYYKEKTTESQRVIESSELDGLHRQLAKAQQEIENYKGLEKFKPLEGIVTDIEELLNAMAKDPLLKYEIMGNYFKYKKAKND